MSRLPFFHRRWSSLFLLAATCLLATTHGALAADSHGTEKGYLALRTVAPAPPTLHSKEGRVPAVVLEAQKLDAEGRPLSGEVSELKLATGKGESGAASMDLSPGTWRVGITGDDWWAASAEVEIEAGVEKSLDLVLLPAGTARGTLVKVADTARLDELSVSFKRSPDASRSATPLEGTSTCQLQQQEFFCKVPAGVLDLRFQAPGTVPEYRWNVEVTESGQQQIEPLNLRRGTAVLGWILTEDGTDVTGAKVRLRPKALGQQRDREQKQRSQLAEQKTTANARGFFRFDGLVAGDYLLEASLSPYATVQTSVRVVPERVTEISDPPLVLNHPLSLSLYLDPPAAPNGEAWKIDLKRLDRSRSTLETLVEQSDVGIEGFWRYGGLAPGSYRLAVGTRGQRRFWREDLVLESGDTTHFVELPVLALKGTVLWGSEPLPARLYFGGAHGAVSIELVSGEEGEFSGFLPRDGLWTVTVEADEPRLRRSLQIVIEPRPGRSEAVVNLDLPATRLHGQVIDDSGQPVPGAVVTAQSQDQIVDAVREKVRDDGTFEILALPPGQTTVIAEHRSSGRDFFSDELAVELQNDLEDGTEIRLVLREGTILRGRVVHGQGGDFFGVPGARVKVEPLPFLGLPAYPQITGAEGEFEIAVPASSQALWVSVAAPGFGFRMLHQPVEMNEPWLLPVKRGGGVLSVELPEEVDFDLWNANKLYIRHASSLELLDYLKLWARWQQYEPTTDGWVTIPNMEAGEYSVCLKHSSKRLELMSSDPRSCAHGFLAPHGQLNLRLPENPDF